MSSADILHFTNQTLWLVLVLSLPPVLVAALIGTLVSLVRHSPRSRSRPSASSPSWWPWWWYCSPPAAGWAASCTVSPK